MAIGHNHIEQIMQTEKGARFIGELMIDSRKSVCVSLNTHGGSYQPLEGR